MTQSTEMIANIYARRSGGYASKFRELMAEETWLNGWDAREHGLIDEVKSAAPAKRSSAACV